MFQKRGQDMYFRLRHILATGFPQKQLAVIRRLGNCLTWGRFGHLPLNNLPTCYFKSANNLLAETIDGRTQMCFKWGACVQGVKKLKPQPLWLSTLQTLAATCNKSPCLSCYETKLRYWQKHNGPKGSRQILHSRFFPVKGGDTPQFHYFLAPADLL